MFQRSPASSLNTRRTAFSDPRPPDSGAKPGALFRLTGNRRWSYMARWNTQTVPTLRHPDSRELRKCSEFLDSGEWANPGLEPGTSSLSGKPFVPSSRPNSNLIPANTCNSAHGRRLETTGRYNLMAASWPHDRSLRARRRMARNRTSRRRYGQARTLGRRAAACLRDRVDRSEPRRVVELVNHVPVGLQGQAGTVTELPRDIVNRAPLMQKQRREAVAQVVIVPTSAQTRICRCSRYADVG